MKNWDDVKYGTSVAKIDVDIIEALAKTTLGDETISMDNVKLIAEQLGTTVDRVMDNIIDLAIKVI